MISVACTLIFRPTRNENQTIESMFAMDDELYSSYQMLKRTFGGNEIILIVYHDDQLMMDSGQIRQSEICKRLNAVEGVSGNAISVQSMISMIESLNVDQFQSILRFMNFDISSEGLIEKSKSLFSGFTHSADEKTAAIVVLLQAKEDTKISRGMIVESLRNEIRQFRKSSGFDREILMVGEPVMVADGFRMVQADGQRLGWVATIALSLVVLIAFRSIRWTLIPAAVVQFSLLTSEAIVALLDIQVTIVGSMSTSIITVIAVSTTIHLIIRIRKNYRDGMDYYSAAENAFRQLATPITFACLTDAVGFGALWFAELEPVQDFATVMFAGSLLVLVAFWCIVPTLALFRSLDGLPFWNLSADKNRLHAAFGKGLGLPLRFSRRFPVVVVLATLGILIFSLVGITRNTIESDFTKNFRGDSEIVRSYNFVEDNLGGAGVWDVMVRAPAKLDIPFLEKIKKLETRLRTEVTLNPVPEDRNVSGEVKGLTKVLSLVDAIEAFSNKTIDQLSKAHLNMGMQMFRQRLPEFQKSLFASDPSHSDETYYRIMLRSRERTTSEQKKNIIDQVNRICSEEFPATDDIAHPTRATGFYVLLTYMIDSVIRDQWTTFAAAAVGIIFMLYVSLQDIRLALVGLLPNLLPIFFVLGGLGWIGEPINLGIALIAAVAIGLSIDSSIHYIFDFQQRRIAENVSIEKALETSQDQVGRALVYSTVALVTGFCSLCTSDFLPTVYFGATAMIAMAGGLLGNLFLLPLFISMVLNRSDSDAEPQCDDLRR